MKTALPLSLGSIVWLIAGAAFAQPAADPYAEMLQYKFDQPRTAAAAIEAEIRVAKPEQLPAIETKLLAILQSPNATKDGKEWACRQLRQAGSEKSVPALAAFLADKELATVARLALQSLPGPTVDAALRDALAKVPGELKAGLAQTIGARRDTAAVSTLAPLASDKDAAVAESALYALGQIGGAEALRAVQAATVPDGLKRYRANALLRCAERLAADGKANEAAPVFRQLFQESSDAVTKIGALRGLLLSDKAQAAPLVTEALKTDSAKVRLTAAKLACEAGGPEVVTPVLAQLEELPADVQVAILSMVADRTALPAVTSVLGKTENEDVRIAALAALGRIGDSAAAKLLLGVATTGTGEQQATARRSLQILRGEAVDGLLIEAAQAGAAPPRAEAIRVLATRGASAAIPLLLKSATDTDATIRTEAFRALGTVADAKTLPAMVDLLVKAADDVRGVAEESLIAACRRAADKDAAAEAVLRALPNQTPTVRCALLRIAARSISARGLDALRAAAKDADETVKDTAVRGLAEWPDAAAAGDLLAIARSGDTPVHKVLALRGVIRQASAQETKAPAAVKLLAEAMPLCSRTDEKKLVLAALADLKHPAALDLATRCLTDKELEVEAATAVVKIARVVQRTNSGAAAAAVQKILDVCQTPAARQVAESSMIVLDKLKNIAPQGAATSPDGFEKDGTASGDQAAIDGDPGTYWDEEDGKSPYRLVVTFKQPEKITALSIMGYEHHRFAPKDFEVLLDDKVIQTVKNAQYNDNLLVVKLGEVTGRVVELEITGYYGGSPAIRELGLYQPIEK